MGCSNRAKLVWKLVVSLHPFLPPDFKVGAMEEVSECTDIQALVLLKCKDARSMVGLSYLSKSWRAVFKRDNIQRARV
ncbi:hypothetical protein WJX72_004605 [[Myrmecia] bisecta]|uniref:F-box domain-containing protein n=1 Tax=[Myrmecia] bisecta TaxID=41462 RepID=A0AAW1P6M4_9CHLO